MFEIDIVIVLNNLIDQILDKNKDYNIDLLESHNFQDLKNNDFLTNQDKGETLENIILQDITNQDKGETLDEIKSQYKEKMTTEISRHVNLISKLKSESKVLKEKYRELSEAMKNKSESEINKLNSRLGKLQKDSFEIQHSILLFKQKIEKEKSNNSANREDKIKKLEFSLELEEEHLKTVNDEIMILKQLRNQNYNNNKILSRKEILDIKNKYSCIKAEYEIEKKIYNSLVIELNNKLVDLDFIKNTNIHNKKKVRFST